MTDKEQLRELVTFLRSRASFDIQYMIAADELERLAAEVERLKTIMSGNVRLVEELDDGAIFEIGPGVRND